jgi:hypothetical protein
MGEGHWMIVEVTCLSVMYINNEDMVLYLCNLKSVKECKENKEMKWALEFDQGLNPSSTLTMCVTLDMSCHSLRERVRSKGKKREEQ